MTALEHAPPGGEYVGTIPPWLMSLIIGRPLVQSLVTSCRVTNTEAAGQLGWRPTRPTLADGLPDAIARLRRKAG